MCYDVVCYNGTQVMVIVTRPALSYPELFDARTCFCLVLPEGSLYLTHESSYSINRNTFCHTCRHEDGGGDGALKGDVSP